jgi:hypothetical protein
MEPKFQTSFIPKKTLTPAANGAVTAGLPKPQVRHSFSVFMSLSVLLFILSLAGIGGAYAWKQYLLSSQKNYQQELAQRKEQFKVSSINKLKKISVQIDTTSELINRHVAISELFSIIQSLTVESVRFTSLNVTIPKEGSSVQISMSGLGKNLSAVAFQSDVLSHLEQYGLRNVIKNPIITDPSLDPNTAVTFGFSAEIDPTLLNYKKSIGATSGSSAGSAANPANPANPAAPQP